MRIYCVEETCLRVYRVTITWETLHQLPYEICQPAQNTRIQRSWPKLGWERRIIPGAHALYRISKIRFLSAVIYSISRNKMISPLSGRLHTVFLNGASRPPTTCSPDEKPHTVCHMSVRLSGCAAGYACYQELCVGTTPSSPRPVGPLGGGRWAATKD